MGYSFVFPGPSELEQRRQQLNLAGFHSWVTPIIFLVTIYTYRRWLRPSTQRSKRPSPAPVIILRRISWLVSTTYMPEFGPLSVQLLGLVYGCWLLYLVFRATGNDYMHLTKSFGHVAIAQLPIHYLLALKHPRSPITLATGLAHERLNAVHRLLGRIVHALLAVHAVLYLNFFIRLDLLAKRLQHLDVRLGVAAFWSFNILSLLALPSVRKRLYHRVFYRSHVLLSALVLPLLFFHVPYTRIYVVQAGAFWLLGGLTRRAASQKVRVVRCANIPGTALVDVRFVVARGSALARAAPGQHVYLRRPEVGLMAPRTPFTIAGTRPLVDRDDHAEAATRSGFEVQLVVRNMGGPQTSWLAGIVQAEPTSLPDLQVEVEVEGPYGESSIYMTSLLESSTSLGTEKKPNGEIHARSEGPILLVAGGVGATYILPIYTSLLLHQIQSSPSSASPPRNMKMVWLVKTLADAAWGIEYLSAFIPADMDGDIDVDIYITASPSSPSPLVDKREHGFDHPPLPPSRPKGVKIHHVNRRPNLRPEIDSFFLSVEPSLSPPSSSSSSRPVDPRKLQRRAVYPEVTAFVCGPRGLAAEVRRYVGRWVLREGRDVRWVEEVFGFGGAS